MDFEGCLKRGKWVVRSWSWWIQLFLPGVFPFCPSPALILFFLPKTNVTQCYFLDGYKLWEHVKTESRWILSCIYFAFQADPYIPYYNNLLSVTFALSFSLMLEKEIFKYRPRINSHKLLRSEKTTENVVQVKGDVPTKLDCRIKCLQPKSRRPKSIRFQLLASHPTKV